MIDRINIKEKSKPKLALLPMEAFEERVNYGGPQGQNTAIMGQAYPYVIINGQEIAHTLISRMEIDCLGFLPKLSLTMSLMSGKVTYFKRFFPRAGDIVSIFIKSPNDNIRPIRNDYQVVTVNYSGSDLPSDAGEGFITITGRLHIPNIYAHKTFSIEGNSYDALFNVSDDLEIGFASNIDSTDDKMRWLTIGNYEKFIKDVSMHSWNGEESFFTSFIDFYYNLNFIDINRQITHANDGQPGVASDINVRTPEDNSTFEFEMDIFKLTNDFNLSSFNNFVHSYNIINNASLITYKEGVIKDYSFYDYSTKNFISDSTLPLASLDTPDGYTPLFANFGTKNQEVREWLGVQYSYPIGNVHRNYNISKMLNHFNNMEMEKIVLETKLLTPNLFLHKGQRLFLEIFSYADKFDV